MAIKILKEEIESNKIDDLYESIEEADLLLKVGDSIGYTNISGVHAGSCLRRIYGLISEYDETDEAQKNDPNYIKFLSKNIESLVQELNKELPQLKEQVKRLSDGIDKAENVSTNLQSYINELIKEN